MSELNKKVMRAIFRSNEDYDFLKESFDNGFDINQDLYGITPLIIAVTSGSDKVLDLILSYHPDINQKTENGLTPLSTLITHVTTPKFSVIDRIKIILSHGASCLMSDAHCYNRKTYKHDIERNIFEQLEYELSYTYADDDEFQQYMDQVVKPKGEIIYYLLRNRWVEEITLFQLMLNQTSLDKRQRKE